MMPTTDIRNQVALALEAVHNKKAEDVALLQLPGESSTFTDYFLICSGSNPRQVQAIVDEVDERLSKDMGVEPNAREGYQTAEWILLDYRSEEHTFELQSPCNLVCRLLLEKKKKM